MALQSQDPRLVKAREGKMVMLSITDFTQHIYNEAAEALMNKATAEGLPPGPFLRQGLACTPTHMQAQYLLLESCTSRY
jgi:hypothetical protein